LVSESCFLKVSLSETDIGFACVIGKQHAIAYVEGDKYYGAKATINVWEPKIQQSNEFSLSQIWVLGGSFGEDLNSIEAGWQVLFCGFSVERSFGSNHFALLPPSKLVLITYSTDY